MATRQIPFEETKEFKLGEEGEDIAISFLQSRGWFVVPSRDYNKDKTGQKAPCLQGKLKGYVLPDLDVSRPEKDRRWVEVKTKSEAPFNRTYRIHVHGLPRRLFLDYRSVQSITGSDVWLYVYESNEGLLLIEKLFNLEPFDCLCSACRRGDPDRCNQSRGGMVYFDRDAFQVVDLRQLSLF